MRNTVIDLKQKKTIKNNNLIIANILIKGGAYIRKNIENEYVIYENKTWESQTT